MSSNHVLGEMSYDTVKSLMLKVAGCGGLSLDTRVNEFMNDLEHSLVNALKVPMNEPLVVDEDLLEELVTLLGGDIKPPTGKPDPGEIDHCIKEVESLPGRVATMYADVNGFPSKQRKIGAVGRQLIQIMPSSSGGLIGLADDGSLWTTEAIELESKTPAWVESESVPLF